MRDGVLLAAFHVSPFDAAVVVSVDGFGDLASAAWGVRRGTRIEVEDKVGAWIAPRSSRGQAHFAGMTEGRS